MSKRPLCLVRALFSALFILALPALAAAQTGRIVGTVTDSADAPLPGTQVTVLGAGLRGTTNDAGQFAIAGVNPGVYEVRAQRIGQRTQTVSNVVVRSGEETAVRITLGRVALELTGIVVSASRRSEKVTEAPATITRLELTDIENSVGNSFGAALKEVKGLDFIQTGVMTVGINARGFNTAFNNRVLQLEDGRIATLPESGLPLGSLTTIPKIDIEAVEVLVGPGSALYGPDASSGVVTLTTKDPKTYPGTTIDIAGGSRAFYDIQGRHAGTFGGGSWGYKLLGEYQAADDWSNHNVYAPVTTDTTQPSPELGADFNMDVMRGGGSLVRYFSGRNGRLELSAGASKTNTIGLTNVGRNQIVDWKYGHGQLRYTDNNWFGQVYHVESRSGDTYQLNGFAQNRRRFPTISDDSVKKLSAFPDAARFTAAEFQNTFAVGMLNDTRFTWGGQVRHDDVSSKRRWLEDRKTGENVKIDQRGVYAQLEAPLGTWLKVVAAGRYDKHEAYDAQWSPKGGVLVTPWTDQTFRVTYNRAFKSPSILQTSFFFPDFQPFIGVFGNRDGFIIRDQNGATVRTISPIEPEINTTWEAGYKGVLGGKLYLDATAYRSTFDRFQSPLVIIANFLTPAAAGGPTFAFNAKTGEQIRGSTGGNQIVLTYFNVGKAKVRGADIGLRYLLTPTIDISGTTSLQQVRSIERRPTDPVEATSFNSPTTKFTLGMDFAQLIVPDFRAGWTVRYVNGYDFLSGVNVGRVPTFATADLAFGYRLPAINAGLTLAVQNVFSCRAGTTRANKWIAAGRRSIYTEGQKCGFGTKHAELINSPEVGTMVFLGMRYHR